MISKRLIFFAIECLIPRNFFLLVFLYQEKRVFISASRLRYDKNNAVCDKIMATKTGICSWSFKNRNNQALA